MLRPTFHVVCVGCGMAATATAGHVTDGETIWQCPCGELNSVKVIGPDTPAKTEPADVWSPDEVEADYQARKSMWWNRNV